MPRDRILALVQAGGAGSRMDVLTRERAKPALPFAGVFQLVDFPLSNLAHSGISDVWLSVQYLGSSLEEQVANGRPWGLDRTRGGLRLLMPQQGTGTLDEEGFARGNADGLYRIRDQIADFAPETLLVLSADHVYRFDYNAAIAAHRASGAACTLVTSTVALDEASNHATVTCDGTGRVTKFAYKPDEPDTETVATEIFVYDPKILVEILEELHRELSAQSEAGDTGLGDFGEHLVPRLVERGLAFAYQMSGYWRDLGQPHKYLQAHQDLLTDDLGVLAEPGWPILTQQPPRVPARVLEGGVVVDSVLSPGVRVEGTVHRSVLGPGVVVEAGAIVRNSVLFTDTVVRSGSTVDWAVVDRDCEIAGAEVGDPAARALDDPDEVVLVGRDSTVGPGARLAKGARLEPGSAA